MPTIAFGVPAGASMAILLGAFLMHGLTPGPGDADQASRRHLHDRLEPDARPCDRRADLPVAAAAGWRRSRASGRKSCCRSSSRWCSSPPSRARTIGAICISLMFFGVVGWIMKRLGWPRPPMVLGLVVGGIFERYLFISTAALRLGLAAAAGGAGDPRLRRLGAVPAAVADRREPDRANCARCGTHRCASAPRRRSRSAIIVFIVAAIMLVAGLAARRQARAAHRLRHGAGRRAAQPVNELFGSEQAVGRARHADARRRTCRPRASTSA